MALMEYLNKPKPASMNEVIAPVQPTVAEASADINYADVIGKKGVYGFFKDFYQKPDLEQEEKIAERQRTLSLLGDIANLGGQMFASSKGARQFTPINSQVPKYNERLQRLRDAKRANDADYQNKSLSAIFKDYEVKRADEQFKSKQEAEKASQELKYARDLTLKQIDQAFQKGMLDAKGKQALELLAAKAKDAKALAALEHKYRLGEIATKSNSDNAKIVDSVIGGDGNVYTRNTRLTDNEAMQIVQSSGLEGVDLDVFKTGVQVDVQGKPVPGTGKVDWRAAAAYALQNGMVSEEELKSRGFKFGGATEKEDVAPWVNNNQSSNEQSNNKAPWLK